MGIPREKLVVVSIMPCLAKKYECARDEFKVNGIPDVDYSISTRELARLIKRANIGFPLVLDSPFDNPMGESTGAGVIFGTTGGVMEAALRSVYEIYTGESLKNVNFEQVRGLNGVRRATINLNGFELKVGIAHGLGNARHLLEDIRNGHNEYHVIEIMACPGGCIGGGGQPLHHGNSEMKSIMSDIKLACDMAEQIKTICDKHGNKPGELINILHEAQHLQGYLPEETQRIIASKLGIPVSKVYGVVTFYTFFTMTPKGKHPISVCMGTACYVRGSEKLLEEFKRVLGIEVGDTTPDGKFSLDCLRCVGACGLAPVVMIGEKVYGRLQPVDVKKIIEELE